MKIFACIIAVAGIGFAIVATGAQNYLLHDSLWRNTYDSCQAMPKINGKVRDCSIMADAISGSR